MTIEEGDLVWLEIPATQSSEQLKHFYTTLFPQWVFHDHHAGSDSTEAASVLGYNLPSGKGGGIAQMPHGCPVNVQPNGCGFTAYYKVNDLEKTEARVHGLGGTTCLVKTTQGGNGWFMNFLDPQGNRFGAFEFAK